MLIDIDKRGGVPIYRQIMDQIKHQILTGQTPVGAQLPSVRELAKTLRVNPITISKAYGYLEMQQYVERQRGIGIFAAAPKTELTHNAKTEIIREMLEKAALNSIQLGLGEKEVINLFVQIFRDYQLQMKEKSDE